MSMKKIDKKITGYRIKTEETPAANDAIEQMHEKLERPGMLVGATYKIKTPLSDHALYITINDIVLNPDTEHEIRRPFEIFINSKNLEHFQWVVALTRVISAVFRKGGDVTFLVEELKAVFDPQGGYFKSGGRFMPSLVAEIGDAIEEHMKSIGLIQPQPLSETQVQVLSEKRREYENKHNLEHDADSYPVTATLCLKCHTKAVIFLDGCKTCLSCGDSKCS